MRMLHSYWRSFALILMTVLITNEIYAQSEISSDRSPLTDITKRRISKERKPLPYPSIDERDILWQKRVVRVVNFKEKMNLYFQSPAHNFMEMIIDGLKKGKLKAYSAEGESFAHRLDKMDLNNMLSRTDTVQVENLDTGLPELKIITDDLDLSKITELRIEEIWFFDTKYSKMHVRIIGIAPIQTIYDDFDNPLFTRPMFWLHYPTSRDFFANHQVAHDVQSTQPISWEDQLERRFFASTIFQVSNIRGDRLMDRYSGIELLQQAAMEEQKIQNFEHDLWSY